MLSQRLKKILAPQVEELQLVNARTSQNACDSFVYEASSPKEESLGELFIVIDISDKEKQSSYIINLLASVIRQEYYRAAERGALASFESALHKANLALADIAGQGTVEWMGHLHAIIAAFEGNTLHVSRAGNAQAILLRQDELSDISEGLASSDPQPHPLKTFTNVASGKLEAGDQVVISTPTLFDYLSLENLRQLLSQEEPAEAMAKIRSSLDEQKDISCCTLLIKVTEETVPVEEEIKVHQYQPVSTKSEEKMSLENILCERGYRKQEQAKPEPVTPSSSNLSSTLQTARDLATKTIGIAKNAIPRKKDSSSINVSSTDMKLGKEEGFLSRLTGGVGSALTAFFKAQKFSVARNILLGLVTVLIIALVANIFIGRRQKTIEENNQALQNMIQKVEQNIATAEAKIISRDDKEAGTLLEEALVIIDELAKDKDFATQAEELKSRIYKQMEVADRLTLINDPELMVNLSDFEAPRNIQGLAKLEDVVLAFDPESNGLYTYDLKEKSENVITETANIGHLTKVVPAGEGKIFFLTDTPGAALHDFDDGNLVSQEISFGPDNPQPASATIYNSRMYILDPEAKQIYKHAKTLEGFAAGQAWIQDEDRDKISQGKDLTIDGSLYVLLSDGNVIRYLRGAREEFTVSSPRRPLENPTQIYTSPDHEQLYILDPPSKRFAIYDKESGRLIKQLLLEPLDQLKGFSVDPDGTTFYFLNNTSVYRVKSVEEKEE